MNREELLKKRDEYRVAMNKINLELGTIRYKENEELVGRYYKYEDTQANVYISVTGVDTSDHLKCHMIVHNLSDNSYSLTKDGIIERGYATNEIKKQDYELIKSVVASYLNVML